MNNKALIVVQRLDHLQLPGPELKRSSPGPTALLEVFSQPPISQLGDLRHAPSPDLCPGHVLAPGPGLDASLEVTKLKISSKAPYLIDNN